MPQQKAISVDAKTNNRLEAEEALLVMAEKELSAFARAVKYCFGPDEARHGFECWMQELEAIDLPISETTPDWRQVTIAAAARLAPRLMPGIEKARNEIRTCVANSSGKPIESI
jgi:hypothetical protein